MATPLIYIVLVALVTRVSCDCDAHWNYDFKSDAGPDSWYKTCTTCGGSSQSPINIKTASVVAPPASDKAIYEALRITTMHTGLNFNLTNTGHSLQLKLEEFAQITVTGAGLPGKYYASQIHWHWGSDELHGSEHTVDSRMYPMEGHLVTYNSKYHDFNSALGQPDGVAVFGMFYVLTSTGNGNIAYNSYFTSDNLKSVITPFASIQVSAYDINYLLPVQRYPFYRYQGSLTTPACTENVLWSVFAEPITILTSQIEMLRLLHFEEVTRNGGPMMDNYRPVQELNGRSVMLVDPHNYIEKDTLVDGNGAASVIASSTTLAIVAMEIFKRLAANY